MILYYITVVYGIGIIKYIYIYKYISDISCCHLTLLAPVWLSNNFIQTSILLYTQIAKKKKKEIPVLGMIYACSLAWSLWQDLGFGTARTRRAKSASRPCHETLWSFSCAKSGRWFPSRDRNGATQWMYRLKMDQDVRWSDHNCDCRW